MGSEAKKIVKSWLKSVWKPKELLKIYSKDWESHENCWKLTQKRLKAKKIVESWLKSLWKSKKLFKIDSKALKSQEIRLKLIKNPPKAKKIHKNVP